jgi:hypothetical protein
MGDQKDLNTSEKWLLDLAFYIFFNKMWTHNVKTYIIINK